MTNEQELLGDPLWDEEEKAVESGGNIRFAKARLYYPLYINRYETGKYFTLPGVMYDEYNEMTKSSTRQGLKEFRGMTLTKGGIFYLALLVLESKDKDGNWFQRHIQFNNWIDKDNEGQLEGNAWLDFQKDEMAKLTAKQRQSLLDAAKTNSWVFIRYVDTETGYKGTFEIKKYLTEISFFKNVTEWSKGSEAHFAQFDNGTGPEHYPAIWYGQTNPEEMINHGRTQLAMSDEELATELQIVGETQDGLPVDVAKIIAEVRDIPEEMVSNPLG